MAATQWTAGTASFSWINPATGLPEVDKGGEPGSSIGTDEITAGKKYRFANFIEVTVELDERGRIVNGKFSERAGMYRGPSFLRLQSAPVGRIGRHVSVTPQMATFRQLVGCRTESPEKIGSALGTVAGAAAGGALAGAWLGPPGMFVGAVALGTVGYFAGREVAEFATGFPPIWTELQLVVKADASVNCFLLSHSLFPSHTLYAMQALRATSVPPPIYQQRGASYDGNDVRLKSWKANGWGTCAPARSGATPGNPWGMPDPGPTIGQVRLEREIPAGYVGS